MIEKKSVWIKVLCWAGIIILGGIGIALIFLIMQVSLGLFFYMGLKENNLLKMIGYFLGVIVLAYLIPKYLISKPLIWLYKKVQN